MRKITTSAYMPTEIKVVNVSENVAQIIAYPFEKGYAVTLAHPLRRLLYTSTAGFAPTAIKIDGVSHEFDSMRGMLEDVALFIINLKNLRFKLKTNSNKEIVEYSFTGPKEIKGEDLNNDKVEIVNSDMYLATINEDANLNFTLVIEKGIGYVPCEEIKDNFSDKDYIVLDAFFTPVKKAVYEIENVLVEDDPDYEKIIFTITTDGQVKPLDAFKHSLEAMYQQMSIFKSILNVDANSNLSSSNDNCEYSKLLESVENLSLSARSFNCLDRADIRYIGELALMDEIKLRELKNLGKKSLDEIKNVMEEIGYPIGGEIAPDKREQLELKIAELKTHKSEG